MRIAVIVPTRGRPDNAVRLQQAFYSTAANIDETHVIFGVDADDPSRDDYESSNLEHIWVGPRLRMAGTLNAIANDIADDYDVLGFMGDDHLPQTPGWDDRIREAMIPGGIVYGNDLIQGPLLPTAVFLDAEIVRRLGHFVPRGFIHLFLDNTWKLWGDRTGRLRYLDDVIIEHIHPVAEKTEWDAGYVEVNSFDIWSADEKRFIQYTSGMELLTDLGIIEGIQ